MPVVNSQIIDDRVIAGKRRVEERHVDDRGRVSYCSYTAAPDTDIQAVMRARKTQIEAQWAEQDANAPPVVLEQMTGEGPPKVEAPDGQTYVDTSEIWICNKGKWKRKGKA